MQPLNSNSSHYLTLPDVPPNFPQERIETEERIDTSERSEQDLPSDLAVFTVGESPALLKKIASAHPTFRSLPALLLFQIDLFAHFLNFRKTPGLIRIKGKCLGTKVCIIELIDKSVLNMQIIFNRFKFYGENPDKNFPTLSIIQPFLEEINTLFSLINQGIIDSNSMRDNKLLKPIQERLNILNYLGEPSSCLLESMQPEAKADRPEIVLSDETLGLLDKMLTMALFGREQLQKYAKEEIDDNGKRIIKELGKNKNINLENLRKQFSRYYNDLFTSSISFSKTLLTFINNVKDNYELLKQKIAKFHPSDSFYVINTSSAFEFFYEEWKKLSSSFIKDNEYLENKKYYNTLETVIKMHCQESLADSTISNYVKKIIKEDIISLAQTHIRFRSMKETCCIEILDDFKKIVDSIFPSMNILEEKVRWAERILNSARTLSNENFWGISLIDQLLCQSIQILKINPHSSEKIKTIEQLNEFIKLSTDLKFFTTPQNYKGEQIAAIRHQFPDQFLAFKSSMLLLCTSEASSVAPETFGCVNTLRLLDHMLPDKELTISLYEAEVDCFLSIFFQKLGQPAPQDLTVIELQSLRNIILQQIEFQENGKEINEIRSQLLYFTKNPEQTGQPVEFWRMNSRIFEIFTKKLVAARNLGSKIKQDTSGWLTGKDFIEGVKPWLATLDLETFFEIKNQLLLLNRVTQKMEHPGGQEFLKYINLLTLKIFHNILLQRSFLDLIEHVEIYSSKNETAPVNISKVVSVPVILKAKKKKRPIVPKIETSDVAQISLHEQKVNPLDRLEFSNPISLEEEDCYSTFLRKERMREATQNNLFLAALLEELKEVPHLPSLHRDWTDHFRLLEMTEKLALAYFPIHGTDTTKHIILDPTQRLLYSHDGAYMASILSLHEPLFTQIDRSILSHQELVLKKWYWFQGKIGLAASPSFESILPMCQGIWDGLAAQSPQIKNANDSYIFTLRRMKFMKHKQKQELLQNASVLMPADLPPLNEMISSFEKQFLLLTKSKTSNLQEYQENLDQITSLARLLDQELTSECLTLPILYTNRLAELQVSLLSLILKAGLAALDCKIYVGNECRHPLDCDHKEGLEKRPLKYSHNVLHLWKAFCKHACYANEGDLRAKLQLFLGDPRYPYPNKTAISFDLITSFELAKLQKLVKDGYGTSQDRSLFHKYFPGLDFANFVQAESHIQKKMQEHLKRQEMKTRCAFLFASQICKLIISQ